MSDSLQFDIRRVSASEYRVNGVKILKVSPPGHSYDPDTWAWAVKPITADLRERPLFTASTLEDAFDLIEGGMRLMAPRDEGEQQ